MSSLDDTSLLSGYPNHNPDCIPNHNLSGNRDGIGCTPLVFRKISAEGHSKLIDHHYLITLMMLRNSLKDEVPGVCCCVPFLHDIFYAGWSEVIPLYGS